MGEVYAIASQKGGVGKTTTAISLGAELTRRGNKVLLVDVDAQGSLTASLGYTEPDSMSTTLATVLEKVVNEMRFEPKKFGILHHAEGFDLMPGNIELAGLEVSLVNAWSREMVLAKYVGQVKRYYDYVILDCMPSLSLMTLNTVMCGSCGRLYSYKEYASITKCNECSHDFNPGCSLHKTIYA